MYVKYTYTQEAFIYHIEWEFFKHLKKNRTGRNLGVVRKRNCGLHKYGKK